MRATIYILGGRSVGRSFELEDSAVIGREPSCQIRLGDKSISRRHARIMWDGFRWRVEDLDSRNGVRLDKQRVREANLADGDEFMLGEVPVRLRTESEESGAGEQDFEFEDDFLAEPSAPTPRATAGGVIQEPAAEPGAVLEPEVSLEDEIELEEEIVLEEEIELGGEASAAAPAGLELSRRPGAAQGLASQGHGPGPAPVAPASRLRKDLDPRAKLLAKGQRSGMLSGDLGQQPAWVLGLLFLGLGALMLGLAYLVFVAVQSLQA